jgi:hypothetical protein
MPKPNELVALVGPFWSETKTCAALGISVSDLASRRDDGTVLGLTTSDGDRLYPIAQFHRLDGRVEVKPALLPLLEALRAFDPWTVAVLLHTPASELDGATPLDWVRSHGAPERLEDLGHVVASEWAAGTPR